MKLKTLIEDAQSAVDHVECTMADLLAIIGGERSTSGKRAQLAEYLSQNDISYFPRELPQSKYGTVTLTRHAGGARPSGDSAFTLLAVQDDVLTLEIPLGRLSQIKEMTLRDILAHYLTETGLAA